MSGLSGDQLVALLLPQGPFAALPGGNDTARTVPSSSDQRLDCVPP